MNAFDKITTDYYALALELLAFIDARVPADGTPRVFRIDYLRVPSPHEDGCELCLHAVRRIEGEVCVLGMTAEDGGCGDEIDPIPVADFLLDQLYSLAAQLAD